MEDQLAFPLAQVFTAAGAVTAGAIVAGLVQLMKRFVPQLPSGGPGVLWMVAALSAGITGLAWWDAGLGLTPQNILLVVLTFAAVATAAIGSFEATAAFITSRNSGEG